MSIIVKYPTSGESTNQECNTPQSCNIPNLTPGTCYNFTIYTQGTGGRSQNGTTTKGCTYPTPPTGLVVTDKTSTTVTLTVTAGDGDHDGYRVLCIGGELKINRAFSQNKSTLLVKGLSPGTTYTFTVFTLSNGQKSESSYGTNVSTEPSTPTTVVVKSQTTHSITLTVTQEPGT
ncbi:exoglucanase A-like isoform X2 [Argopecten irradians]|uniref:exoglucanase A-like isoform X2 n=1 Tax=Argopecten irradians TaxID=31199 RepID=UPI003710D165